MRRVAITDMTPAAVAAEWDAIAPVRHRQISQGADHSATAVLAPSVLSLLPRVQSAIDIGCGTGWLSRLALRRAARVVGVDVSARSIELANGGRPNLKLSFVHAEFTAFAKTHEGKFDAAISNMTLSTVPNLSRLVRSIKQTLRRGGTFVFTIPHPCFWPTYWQYSDAEWFSYDEEIAIESNFKIGNERTEYSTTHVHRPLRRYTEVLRQHDFAIADIRELYGKGFDLPRFVAVRCVRGKASRLTRR